MPPVHFTVSQVRVAASCPRILYFDAEHTRRKQLKSPSVTRLWKSGPDSETTACGTLFHGAIEKFNQRAATDAAVRQLLGAANDPEKLSQELLQYVYWNCLEQATLFQKSGPQQAAFMTALRGYLAELADILTHARKIGRPEGEVLDELFGDRRRRVDVTFPVGPEGEPVHVTGVLDYVFYDWRTAHHRILDYKLTPAREPSNDLFQVCLYALMHHAMHRTEPDVGVLYLHPRRELLTLSWAEVKEQRYKVFNLLASMRQWVQYDEKTGAGLKPPGEPNYCPVCRWDAECEQRLGPKSDGDRLRHWNEQHCPDVTASSLQGAAVVQPSLERGEPPAVAPPQAGSAAERPGREHDEVTHSADQLWIGYAVTGQEPVGLPVHALPTHITVVGAAGSGKTWLAKVVAEEAILQGVPVLAVDPQGDLVQFLRRPEGHSLPEGERSRYERYWSLVEPRILTPGSSHGMRVSLSPVRIAAEQDMTAVADPQLRSEERNALLTTVAGNIVRAARGGGEVDSQQTFVLQVLRKLTARDTREVSLADVAAALKDPDSVGLEDADTFVKKSERERLARKCNSLLYGPAAHLFTGGTPLDVEELRQPSTPGKVPLNVLYLNALPDDEQKQLFVAALAAEIYRWMVTAAGSPGRPSLLFYLDEARDYLPAGARRPPAKEPLLRLFAQGRKYGVGCLLCTQSPRSVDYNVFGNCSTKLIGRLESAQDVERVGEWFSVQGPAPAWLRGRPGAAEGTFVGRWPGQSTDREGQVFKSRPLFSAHGGAWTPERVAEEWAKGRVGRGTA